MQLSRGRTASMITIDLITGFLGAGKTTFIRTYAQYLLAQGEKLCILENDYGAINIDRVLLSDLLGPQCELEMVVGGDGREAHRRRFRTKLISMAMLGYTRVIVEPSGIYDVDEFFDTLCEDPLDRWYTVGSVLTIVDSRLEASLSDSALYLLAAEAANAGKIILSKLPAGLPKTEDARPRDAEQPESVPALVFRTLEILNRAMEKAGCRRRFHAPADILAKCWDELETQDFAALRSAGFVHASYLKRHFSEGGTYQSLFFMQYRASEEEIKCRVRQLLSDTSAGNVLRIKGFSAGLEINATKQEQCFRRQEEASQDVIIVIGEGLRKDVVSGYFPGAVTA